MIVGMTYKCIMLKIRLMVVLILVLNRISAQNENEVVQFSGALNQFLNVRDFCISKDGSEAFFTIQSPLQDISQIAYITRKDNEWTKPELLPFSDSYMDLEPFLSIDGKRLFLFQTDLWMIPVTRKKTSIFGMWNGPVRKGNGQILKT